MSEKRYILLYNVSLYIVVQIMILLKVDIGMGGGASTLTQTHQTWLKYGTEKQVHCIHGCCRDRESLSGES